jgi:hypothetical protein
MLDFKDTYQAKPRRSSERNFGLVFAAFFLFVALFPLLRAEELRIWATLLSGGFFTVAFAAPKLLAPANYLWTKFGELLHKIVSPISLGIVFYLTVWPTGIVLRILRKDPLRLRLDPSAESYWIDRNPPGPPAQSLNEQF